MLSSGRVFYLQSEPSRLCVASPSGELIAQREHEGEAWLACDDDGVVLWFAGGGVTAAYDHDLNEVWRYVSGKQRPHNDWCPVSIHSDTVVVNIGAKASNREGEVVGLERGSGRVRWSRLFDRLCRTATSDSRVFVAAGRQIVSLDAATGEIVGEAVWEGGDAGASDALAVENGRLLYANYAGCSLRVLDSESMSVVVESAALSEEYMAYQGVVPFAYRECWYLPMLRKAMHMRGTSYALCEVRVDDAVPAAMFIRRPESRVNVVSRGEQDAYRLTVDTTEPRVLRQFFPILVREIAKTYGNSIWGAPEQNPRFGGEVELHLTAEQEPMVTEAKALLAQTEEVLKGLGQLGGDGRSPIVLKVLSPRHG